jgi:hypothetical protein
VRITGDFLSKVIAIKEDILCNLSLMKVGCKVEVLGKKPAPSTTLSTTNPVLPDLGIEPGPPQREAGAVTNRLCYKKYF